MIPHSKYRVPFYLCVFNILTGNNHWFILHYSYWNPCLGLRIEIAEPRSDLHVWSEPHLYCVPLFCSPSMATRLTLNGQSVSQAVGAKTPGCCWVRVVQACVGAPLLRAAASRKHNDARTRRATRKHILGFCYWICCKTSDRFANLFDFMVSWTTFCACARYWSRPSCIHDPGKNHMNHDFTAFHKLCRHCLCALLHLVSIFRTVSCVCS